MYFIKIKWHVYRRDKWRDSMRGHGTTLICESADEVCLHFGTPDDDWSEWCNLHVHKQDDGGNTHRSSPVTAPPRLNDKQILCLVEWYITLSYSGFSLVSSDTNYTIELVQLYASSALCSSCSEDHVCVSLVSLF